MKTVSQFLFGALFLALGFSANANNLTITNVSLTGATSTTIQVQYNMFWDNSWRDLENWDAAWVFVKYSTNAGLNWSHATLNATGHVGGTATPTPTIHIPQDNMGAFIYRSAAGSGTYTITGQQLRWNFTANGLNQTQASGATIRVFGMEMVYIPQGEYYLGDGVNYSSSPSVSLNSFYRNNTSSSSAFVPGGLSEEIVDPFYGIFRIHGINGIDLNNDTIIGTWPTDAPSFPSGYRAFYCMKYKVTQGQFTDFLNTLTYDQQSQRVNSAHNTVGAGAYDGSSTTLPTHRNNIFVLTAGTSNTIPRIYTATRPDRECNFVNWPDAAAYLDWASLRPFTDMEKEKIGRGPVPPVYAESAEGTASSFTSLSGITSGIENGTEVSTNSASIYNVFSSSTISGGDNSSFIRGPIRSGMFAGSSTSRIQSGSTYYGVKDFCSGLIEFEVAFSTLAGRSFTGLHGNGNVDASGFGDVDFWPGINANSSYSNANTSYSGTGIQSGAGIVFTGTIQSISTSGFGPWVGSSYPTSYVYPYLLSARFNIGYINLNSTSTSTGYKTQYTGRYQQLGFRGVKSNL